MKTIKKTTEVVEVVTALICDRCGRSAGTSAGCRLASESQEDTAEEPSADLHGSFDVPDIYEAQEFLSISFRGGYGSIFGDGLTFSTELCQHCVKDVLGAFLRQTGDDNFEVM